MFRFYYLSNLQSYKGEIYFIVSREKSKCEYNATHRLIHYLGISYSVYESVSYVRGSRFFVWVAPCSGNELAAAILRHHKRVREKV